MKLRFALCTAPVFLAVPECRAQGYFVCALGGVATLSADATSRLGSTNAVSLYKPENGAAFNACGGVHLDDWFSVQVNYVWNRNDIAITELAGLASFQQDRHSSQHAGIAELLVYFRPRRSRIRPYLTTGTGVLFLRSKAAAPAVGTLPPPPYDDSLKLPIRVAVGVDLMARSGWGFRYSFAETMSTNPFSANLDPRGSRRLANFQNLFGFVKYF